MRRRANNKDEQDKFVDTDDKKKKQPHVRPEENKNSQTLTKILILVIVLCAGLVALNTYQIQALHQEQMRALETKAAVAIQQNNQPQLHHQEDKPTVLVWSPRVHMKHLRHVFEVFERIGYRLAENNESKWDVLWAHDYPFHIWGQTLRNLKPHQKVNHFPGTGYVTTKVSLATSGGPYIPPAFKIPEDKDKLLEYEAAHPNAMFVEKNNDHRHVQVKLIKDLDFNSTGSFVQEFMSKPLLISGYKFDIGVYTIITSIDPLRIYKFDGDVLFRFCEEPYEPFDASKPAQYVIGEDYLPAWKVPDLQIYSELSFSPRDAFDAHIRSIGKDPAEIWWQVDEAISSIYLAKEKHFADLLSRFSSKRSFFEMVRFDFIVGEDLTVYMLEANMSPNLSSLHYQPNAILYEQVLYSLLSLVGVASYLNPQLPIMKKAQQMVAADRNLMVFPEVCATCETCTDKQCQLCHPCLHSDTLSDLNLAYKEHVNRQRCKRIFPPPMTQEEARKGIVMANATIKNELMMRWFQGKCLLDQSWCQ